MQNSPNSIAPSQKAIEIADKTMKIVTGEAEESLFGNAPGLAKQVAGLVVALEKSGVAGRSGQPRYADEWLLPSGEAGTALQKAIAIEIDINDRQNRTSQDIPSMERMAGTIMQELGGIKEMPESLRKAIKTSAEVMSEDRSAASSTISYSNEKLADLKELGVPLFRDGDDDFQARQIKAAARLREIETGADPRNPVEAGIKIHIEQTGNRNRNDVDAKHARTWILAEYDYDSKRASNISSIDPASARPGDIAARTEVLTMAKQKTRKTLAGSASMETHLIGQALLDNRLSAMKLSAQKNLFLVLQEASTISPIMEMSMKIAGKESQKSAPHMEIERGSARNIPVQGNLGI